LPKARVYRLEGVKVRTGGGGSFSNNEKQKAASEIFVPVYLIHTADRLATPI
jgi:hypothetical protein